MSGPTAALIEMVFGFGVVLAWAFWELWSLRRDKRRDDEAAAARLSAQGSAQGSGHPEEQPRHQGRTRIEGRVLPGADHAGHDAGL